MSEVLDDWRDCSVHELNKDPEDAPLVIVSINHIETEAVMASAHSHQSNFVVHQLLVFFTAGCAEFQGELFLITLALDSEDFGKAADS